MMHIYTGTELAGIAVSPKKDKPTCHGPSTNVGTDVCGSKGGVYFSSKNKTTTGSGTV
jgi:hypothetical protein